MEGYEQFDIAADAVEACRTARDDFTRVARQGLRVDGAPVAPTRDRVQSGFWTLHLTDWRPWNLVEHG